MIDAVNAARYLISLDPDFQYFNKKVITLNGRTFYEGNARLNKMLHLAQNTYIGRNFKKIIDTDFYAYDNGAVVLDVQENYAFLLGTAQKVPPTTIPQEVAVFLKKIFNMLKDAPIEELIEIDHEDPAWREKHCSPYKSDLKMDSMKFLEDYKDRYAAANFYLDNVVVE